MAEVKDILLTVVVLFKDMTENLSILLHEMSSIWSAAVAQISPLQTYLQ